MPNFRIVLLGAYGQFGSRIATTLSRDAGLELVLAGRSIASANQFAATLRAAGSVADLRTARLDVDSAEFARELQALAPQLVIHTAGPFQGRDYAVAQASLQAGAHYVDLADGRAFVMGFGQLDALAKQCGRRAITGASSVPALSAAVVAAFRSRFARLDVVESAISPGNRTPRGLATTRAILSYVGRPFPMRVDGRWENAHGWQSLRRLRDPDGRTRWLARCDVPDLALLPALYPDLQTCEFRAGLELRRMHFGLWLASWAVRSGLVRRFERWAPALLSLSERSLSQGSDLGLMQVRLRGTDLHGVPQTLDWRIAARDGSGPQIPATAAIVLARRFARGALAGAGAGPCVGLFDLDEFLAALHGFPIATMLDVTSALD